MTTTSNFLFFVIKSSLIGYNVTIPFSEKDFENLMTIGKKHDILPIIWEGFRRQRINPEWENRFTKDRLLYIRRSIIRNDYIQKIQGALNDAHIQFIPLKGAVLQNLYPDSWMRTSSDIDVLVHEDDLQKAIITIEENTDLSFDKRNYHDVTMISIHYCLELHFSIKENMDNIDEMLERVWDILRCQRNNVVTN